MRNKIQIILFTFIFGVCFFPLHVKAEASFGVTAECQRGQKVDIIITLPEYYTEEDGFEIYRLNAETGQYDLVGIMDLYANGYNQYMDDDGYEYYYYTGKIKLHYTIDEVHTIGSNYQYQIKSFVYKEMEQSDEDIENEYSEDYETDIEVPVIEKVYLETVDTSVLILGDAPQITYGKRTGKTDARIKWTQDVNADGYMIYYVSNYDQKSNPVMVDEDDLSQYKLVKTIKKNSTGSNKFTKLMNGVTYTYRICSYTEVNGQKIVSMMSEPVSILMDYYSYDGEDYYQRVKRAFGSEKKKANNFKTAAKASKQMKTIRIKVWDFKNGKNGKKVSKTKYLTVNKSLAPSIKAMFDEIYKSKEKQVIKDIGCYSYRSGEHMYGMAIDINPNENYMIDGKTILSGSFWNPKKSKYSIPLKCETVRIIQRYGFYRGFWGDRKDYMHFSYFGT